MPFKTVLKITFNLLLWLLLVFCTVNQSSVVYLAYQAAGQMRILAGAQSIQSYRLQKSLTAQEDENLRLIEKVKAYSVDSISFRSTNNFTTIYNQNNKPLLWVVSASLKYSIRPYYWNFPIVGKVSYKGFFDKEKAIAEKYRLIIQGYDVDVRSVSAWSTLGWFKDPVLSSMLVKNKGNLCNLIFHELFHSTYYAKGSVDFNENLASFIAHKATIMFLKNDSVSLKQYLNTFNENAIIDRYITETITRLEPFFDSIALFPESQKQILKLKKMSDIANAIRLLDINNNKKEKLAKQILESKNAWFVDFKQYNSLQDSLENVFNKNYNFDLRKLVQSLK